MIVQGFSIVKSKWPNEDGYEYYTITDGVRTKGEFLTKESAKRSMERIILTWRSDN